MVVIEDPVVATRISTTFAFQAGKAASGDFAAAWPGRAGCLPDDLRGDMPAKILDRRRQSSPGGHRQAAASLAWSPAATMSMKGGVSILKSPKPSDLFEQA